MRNAPLIECKRIAVDMDNVLADTLGELLARYNHEHGACLTKADLHGTGLRGLLPEDQYARVQEYLRSDDFFEDLPVMADSQSVLLQLTGRYEIFIASAAMEFPNSFGPKYRWLRRYFPFLDPHHFVFCGDKSILRADVLVDDAPRYLRGFCGEKVLFSAPHNLHETGFLRVDNWREVAGLFLQQDADPTAQRPTHHCTPG